MLGSLLRTGVLIAIWRKYLHPRFKWLFVSFAVILMINLVHSEAISFLRETQQTEYAKYAFFLRWAGWTFVGLAYFLGVERRLARAAHPIATDKPQHAVTSLTEADPFDSIRQKPRIETRSQQLRNRPAHGENDKP